LVKRFPLFDNFYDPSRQSADGHQWITEGMAPYADDIQSPDWVRSYPGGNAGDSLAYQNKGFLFSEAAAAGLPVKIYGEYVENDTFKQPNGQFPLGALHYFTVPTFPTTGAPPPPGVGRNSLPGPNYLSTDMDVQKTFGIPSTRVFGENAGLTIRAMFFNIFNKTNLTPFNVGDGNTQISTDGVTSNPLFGQSSSALGARVIEFQGRFSF